MFSIKYINFRVIRGKAETQIFIENQEEEEKKESDGGFSGEIMRMVKVDEKLNSR